MSFRIAHVNDRNGLIAVCVISSVFSTAAVILRFYARKLKNLQFQIDDWLSAVSLVRRSALGCPSSPGSIVAKDVFRLGIRPRLERSISCWYALLLSCYAALSKSGCVRVCTTRYHRPFTCRERLANLYRKRAPGGKGTPHD